MVSRRPYQSLISIARGRTRGVSATVGGTRTVNDVSRTQLESNGPTTALTTNGKACTSSMCHPLLDDAVDGPPTRDEYVPFPAIDDRARHVAERSHPGGTSAPPR